MYGDYDKYIRFVVHEGRLAYVNIGRNTKSFPPRLFTFCEGSLLS
jgi:hypothetical protein